MPPLTPGAAITGTMRLTFVASVATTAGTARLVCVAPSAPNTRACDPLMHILSLMTPAKHTHTHTHTHTSIHPSIHLKKKRGHQVFSASAATQVRMIDEGFRWGQAARVELRTYLSDAVAVRLDVHGTGARDSRR